MARDSDQCRSTAVNFIVMTSPFRRYVVISFVAVFFLVGIVFYRYDSSSLPSFPQVKHGPLRSSGDASLQQVLQFIYNPTKFSLTSPAFETDGRRYELPDDHHYTSPLGKDVCILDVDTRPFENKGQVFHEGNFDWDKQEPYTGGILNHYTYAQIHGYDYHFINAANYTDRHATWIKPSAIANILHSYKFVIFLDADATFANPEIPIEWLLNYWSIDPSVSLAMALDPPKPTNNDTMGRRYSNTGFIIAQNNPRTFEILKVWDDCPNDIRYPGCSEWKKPRFHEQSAFGTYVRYDYDEWIKELPCDEANGEPDGEDCRGVFISHWWWRTNQVGTSFGDMTMKKVMGRLHGAVIDEKHKIVEVQKDNKIQ
ncbi:hypothetical protein BCR34DRAFT_604905 [Clohesyomyces aquaticus]|uniref:Nucleotide-diphospho-sugar transferase domain-containing protein n=1 Tax=Clohesyomyces aquaticus TaxID=1231657 RepID=A0A1Y1Z2S0_9PLEO|nr:hypothetical protein BCR34DRAFT_604905 [Clohesyomyces aquaticus]